MLDLYISPWPTENMHAHRHERIKTVLRIIHYLFHLFFLLNYSYTADTNPNNLNNTQAAPFPFIFKSTRSPASHKWN